MIQASVNVGEKTNLQLRIVLRERPGRLIYQIDGNPPLLKGNYHRTGNHFRVTSISQLLANSARFRQCAELRQRKDAG